jgi:hypothetical protein
MEAPVFGALDALSVDYRGGGAGLSANLFAAFLVERMMDFAQPPVVVPVESASEAADCRCFQGVNAWLLEDFDPGAQPIEVIDSKMLW